MKKLLSLFGLLALGLLSVHPAGKNYNPRVAFTNSLDSGVVPWTPQTPANTLRQWSKADAITPQGDGTTLQTWVATVGKDFTQATSGNRPTYETSELNGLPVVRFDGVDNWMATAAWDSAQPQPYTLLMVFHLQATNGIQRVITGLGSEAALRGTSSDGWYIYGGGSFIGQVEPGPNLKTNIVLIRLEGTTSTNRWNASSAVTVGSNPGTTTLTGLTLGDNNGGGVNPATVDFAEIIVWDGTLTAANVTSAFNYLNTKWGLGWTIP